MIAMDITMWNRVMGANCFGHSRLNVDRVLCAIYLLV